MGCLQLFCDGIWGWRQKGDVNYIKKFFRGSGRTVDWSIYGDGDGYLNYANRSVWVSTKLYKKGEGAYCLYRNRYVSLEFGDSFRGNEPELLELLVFVRNHFDDKRFEWVGKYSCRYKDPVDDLQSISEALKITADSFDVVFTEYEAVKAEQKTQKDLEDAISEDCKEIKKVVGGLTYEAKFLRDINFKELQIPPYQRAYKWHSENVNQLINDVICFKDKPSYRFGTLVLNRSNIVDGQQRTITIILILYYILSNKGCSNEYLEVYESVVGFMKRTKFKNKISLCNISKNLRAIRERDSELDKEFLDMLLKRCEFIVINLDKESEAFQFFDSQNSRGKPLEPHDLLKAYHLRAIEPFEQYDSDNITKWQKIKTEDLVSLFLLMYRIKRWSKGQSAIKFTMDDVKAFKGVSAAIKDKKLAERCFPAYMQAVICQLYAIENGQYLKTLLGEDKCYPFQLDQAVVNGRRFFDMVLYYNDLVSSIRIESYFKDVDRAEKILKVLNSYGLKNRDGDKYVRVIFDALTVYFIDRFGKDDKRLGRVIEKFFLFAYTIRLRQFRVSLVTMDNHAKASRMFKLIRDASDPDEIANVLVDSIPYGELAENFKKTPEVFGLFNELGKIYGNEYEQ